MSCQPYYYLLSTLHVRHVKIHFGFCCNHLSSEEANLITAKLITAKLCCLFNIAKHCATTLVKNKFIFVMELKRPDLTNANGLSKMNMCILAIQQLQQ